MSPPGIRFLSATRLDTAALLCCWITRAADAVFGPFDCQNGGVCIDEKGTEDPRLHC